LPIPTLHSADGGISPFGYPPQAPAALSLEPPSADKLPATESGSSTPPQRHVSSFLPRCGAFRADPSPSDGRVTPSKVPLPGMSVTATEASRPSAATMVRLSSAIPTCCTPYFAGPTKTRSPGRMSRTETGLPTMYCLRALDGCSRPASPNTLRTSPSHEYAVG